MWFVVSSFPVYPAKRLNRHSVAGPQFMGGRVVPMERAPVRRSNTMPPNLGNSGILGRASTEERVPGGTHIKKKHPHTYKCASVFAGGVIHIASSQMCVCVCRSGVRSRDGSDHLRTSQLDRCGLCSVCRLLQVKTLTESNLKLNKSSPCSLTSSTSAVNHLKMYC